MQINFILVYYFDIQMYMFLHFKNMALQQSI